MEDHGKQVTFEQRPASGQCELCTWGTAYLTEGKFVRRTGVLRVRKEARTQEHRKGGVRPTGGR